MAYTLQAIVIPAAARDRATQHGLPSVDLLAQGLCLIPLLYDRIEDLGIPFLPLNDSGEPTISQTLDGLCRIMSANARVAYVEAEFFGGDGTQGCALYENGVPVSDAIVNETAINHALRWMGVQRNAEQDEFIVAGFGLHRNTEDWLTTE